MDGKNMSLRPHTLEDVVGQTQAKENLQIIMDAAKMRNEVLAHMLLYGPSGTGKTSLAEIVAREMGTEIQTANAANLSSVKAILPYIMRIKEGSILFLDEIHRIPAAVQEFLYPVLEDFRCDVGGMSALSIDIPRFTMIGATTDVGKVERPMYYRCDHRLELVLYSVGEIQELVDVNMSKYGIGLKKCGSQAIARASRGTPRIANSNLRWIRDYTQAKKLPDKEIDRAVVEVAMQKRGISPDGLTEYDRRYLKALIGGPMGLTTLSSAIDVEQDTIANTIEPFLIRMGKIRKTPKGRVLV
jgi:Holliday junction DNA helicase RuvB